MSVTSQEAVNVTDASGNDVKALTKLTEDMKILDVQSQESPTLNGYDNGMGVKKVATLGDVPDGSYLVCYGKLPDFPSIQSKRLTCVLINPDNENQFIVCQQKNHVLSTIDGAACGRPQSDFVCMCFGPTAIQPSGDMEHPIQLSAAFSAVTGGKRDIKDIYAVDGYI